MNFLTKKISLLVTGMLLMVHSLQSQNQKPERSNPLEEIEKKIPALVYSIDQPEIIPLQNGQRLYFKQDNELPLVQIRIAVERGKIHDPAGKEGIADLFARTWRLSGSRQYSGQELNSFFEFVGGSLEVSFDSQYGWISMSVLKKDLPAALERMRAFLEKPIFAPDQFDLARQLELDELQRKLDRPISLGFYLFLREYFQSHPYGRQKNRASLQAITLADLELFFKESIHRQNLHWVISGDVRRQEALQLIAAFSLPEKGSRFSNERLAKAPAQTYSKPLILIFDKKIQQSTILIGGAAPEHASKDRYAIRIANFILGGGGFNSRLMREVRSNRGLAYSVGSMVREFRDFGFFLAYAQTKNSSVAEVISLMRQQMSSISSLPINDSEVNWARESLRNKFVFLFTNSMEIALQRFALDHDTLPGDYLETFLANLDKVPMQEIQSVASRYMDPRKMIIVVVGPADQLRKSLAHLGEIRILAD